MKTEIFGIAVMAFLTGISVGIVICFKDVTDAQAKAEPVWPKVTVHANVVDITDEERERWREEIREIVRKEIEENQ